MPVTIMQATQWNKYSFEEWCRQLGAWLNGDSETMTRIVKVMPTKRITQKQREKLLAMYMADALVVDRLCNQRKGTCCELDCNEARAIQRIFLDIGSEDDEILSDWVAAIWSHYVMGNSIRNIAKDHGTYISQIQQDIKCGFAYIKCRHPYFNFEKFTKKGIEIVLT